MTHLKASVCANLCKNFFSSELSESLYFCQIFECRDMTDEEWVNGDKPTEGVS